MNNKITFPQTHRANQKNLIEGYCSKCFEFSIFRAVKAGNKNRLACVICLASEPMPNSQPVKYNKMIMKTIPNRKQELQRKFTRLKHFFLGNHIFFPFKIKRRSKLGTKITMFLITTKGA